MTYVQSADPSRADRPGRARRLAAPAGVLAGLAGAVTYVALVDPNERGHYPTCPFLFLTGFYCPGCGGLRMVHALAGGQPAEAFTINPLAFLLIPVAGYLWIRWVVCCARGEPMSSALFGPRTLGVGGAILMIFWVLRNLPFAQALAP